MTIKTIDEHAYEIVTEEGTFAVCKDTLAKFDPPSEAWLRKVADGHGFTVESHTLEVFGLCPDCQKAQKAQKAAAQ